MSNSPFRWPTNANVLPSGDQPCQYEGPAWVIRRGVPPASGNKYTSDSWVTVPSADFVSCELSLIASWVESGEMPWSLFTLLANPVSIICGSPPAICNFSRCPLRLKIKYEPSCDQLGASKRPWAT